MLLRILTVAIFALPASAFAETADDMNAEVDQLNADSDAAAADTAEVKARMAKDKARSEKALRAAHLRNQEVAAKRQATADTIKQNDQEVAHLQAEQQRLKAEVERLNRETTLAEKQSADGKTQIEKLTGEIEALKTLRNEKAQAFITLSTASDKVTEETKKLELEKNQLELDLTKSKEQEKLASEKLARVKAEQAAKKVKLEAYIAGLRERFHQAQERITATEAEANAAGVATQKLEATAKTAENEVIAAEAQIGRTPTAAVPPAPSALPPKEQYVYKRECSVFEQPAKGAKVLMKHKPGTQVSKSDEGKTWIAFTLPDGRQGYSAKNCF